MKVSEWLEKMNQSIACFGIKFGTRSEYAKEYLEDILQKYMKLTGIKPNEMVRGRGHHKTMEQRYFDLLDEYIEKLKKYAEHIKICGDSRNSFCKTDKDATFFRTKKDYIGNVTYFRVTMYSLGYAISILQRSVFGNTPSTWTALYRL